MADEPEDKMTVRERRAQRAKATAIKTAPARLARKAIVPGIVLLLIAAIVTGFVLTDKAAGKCPTHWHATFDVYVQEGNGSAERMSFRHGAYDLNGLQGHQPETPLRAHMHQGDNKNQWHFEQGGLCVGIEEALGYIDVDLSSKTLKLGGHHAELGQAGTYREDATHNLTAYIQHISNRGERDQNDAPQFRRPSADLEWKEHSIASILDYQLKDGERLLILYGDYTPEQVRGFKDAMAPVDGYYPQVYEGTADN